MIPNCPRCNATLETHQPITDFDRLKDVYFCAQCPKVELYKGYSNSWLSLNYFRGTKNLSSWSVTVPGWVMVRSLQYETSTIYDGGMNQYEMHLQGYNPPDDLWQKPEDQIIAFIKTYMIFQ